ncbi:MAG: hypothetical protein JWM34_4971 [Ilumatobacteraceae bacterium]|nr:hypothetical protein [Ilumatobacteraceae bacterium]
MTDLQESIRRQADTAAPHPDLDDVMRRVGRRRTETRRLGIASAAALVALCIAGVAVVGRHDPTVTETAAPTSTATPTTRPPAPVPDVGGIALAGSAERSALDRRDAAAEAGPWSVIVRGPHGSLGVDSAIVTYPDEAPGKALRPVQVGDVIGSARDGAVIWKLGIGYARVQGDLPEAELIRIADAVSVDAGSGHAVVAPISGYTVGTPTPYRSPDVHELRYYSDIAQDTLAGLVYTGVFDGASFEDQLLQGDPTLGFHVDGHPAVVSTVQGGNATLAWELSPGVVAYVGYSGAQLTHETMATLQDLANASTVLTNAGWGALGAQVVEQPNGPTLGG